MERGVAELGFVGLGVMGSEVVKRLLDAGHTVYGWNRTRGKAEALRAQGMHWADSPRELAERSEIVFTMVTNTAAVRAVTDGRDGILAGLRPDSVYVDMSTASPANTALARLLRLLASTLRRFSPKIRIMPVRTMFVPHTSRAIAASKFSK